MALTGSTTAFFRFLPFGEMIVRIIGVIAVLFFGWGTIYFAKSFLNSDSVLVLDSEGSLIILNLIFIFF